MSSPPSSGFLDIGAQRLEYRWIGPRPEAAPTLVLLHEGLGCVGMWGPFPDQLAVATGCGVFVYSRAGYGQSSPVALPRRLNYMTEEARDALPLVLEAIGFRHGLLVGHSDGASIAAIYAGSHQDHRVRGLVLIAPHFICEDVTNASITEMRKEFETGELRPRLARWHADVDATVCGWSDVWLGPDFRAWDISEHLAYVRVPILIVQGADDQYGTLRQIEIAQEECYCPVDVALLHGARHVPQREAPEATMRVVTDFISRVMRS
ncbi:MAG: alpha/beta fold hydrolase [Rhizobiales bacterium]|nr:alpha/beta fold hydrolase [Hyphomicrobiales bacterium]